MMKDKPSSAWPLLLAALAFAVIGALYWRGLQQPLNGGLHELTLPSVPVPEARPADEGDVPLPAPAPVNPVEQSAAGHIVAGAAPAGAATPEAVPAPPPPFTEALQALVGEAPFAALVVSDDLVNRIVVAIDNLPNEKLPVRLWPLRAVGGLPRVTDNGGRLTLAADNAARYTDYIAVLQALDMRQLAALYVREYPRFQDAYRALGYPNGYFNDRLVDVIDHLLVTPDLSAPPALVQPKVMYQYAADDLESRSVGQKILLRIGPANAGVVKARLRELRRLVARGEDAAKE